MEMEVGAEEVDEVVAEDPVELAPEDDRLDADDDELVELLTTDAVVDEDRLEDGRAVLVAELNVDGEVVLELMLPLLTLVPAPEDVPPMALVESSEVEADVEEVEEATEAIEVAPLLVPPTFTTAPTTNFAPKIPALPTAAPSVFFS